MKKRGVLAGVLLLVWSLGLLFSRTLNGALHLLPLVSAALLIYSVIRRRRSLHDEAGRATSR